MKHPLTYLNVMNMNQVLVSSIPFIFLFDPSFTSRTVAIKKNAEKRWLGKESIKLSIVRSVAVKQTGAIWQ